LLFPSADRDFAGVGRAFAPSSHIKQTHDRTRRSRPVTMCHASATVTLRPFEKVPRENKKFFLRDGRGAIFQPFRNFGAYVQPYAVDDEDDTYGL
jgi:hypothetical protein